MLRQAGRHAIATLMLQSMRTTQNHSAGVGKAMASGLARCGADLALLDIKPREEIDRAVGDIFEATGGLCCGATVLVVGCPPNIQSIAGPGLSLACPQLLPAIASLVGNGNAVWPALSAV